MGLAALDMLRIEAGLILAGYEFSDETDPYEAGIGFAVSDREEDFIGRDALRRRAANPLRKLVGLVIDAGEPVNHGDCVHVGRAQIGVVTSAMRSPVLHESIALARIDAHHAVIGTEVEIGKLDGQQRRLKARVVRFPHYDPDKYRVRA
jgi:aminomethyltransferase